MNTSQLIERCLAGDHAAIQRLVAENQRIVFRLSLSILDDPAEADEATQDASVAYLTPKIIQVEGCQQFLAVLGDEGTGSGLRVFQWDGEGMKVLLRVPGRYLFAEPEIIEGMGITAPPGSLSIMDLVHSDAKNLWVVRVFQWDGGEFRQIIQKEVSYPGGG